MAAILLPVLLLSLLLLPVRPPLAQDAPREHKRSLTHDPTTYVLADGAHEASLPFELLGNQVLLGARVEGGGPLRLVLDTGMPISGVLLFETERVDALGLPASSGRIPIGGGGAEERATSAKMVPGIDVAVGPLAIGGTTALVVARPEGFPPGIDGVIGGALFFHYVVRIDMDARRVVLTEPDGWTPPEGAARVPLTRERGMVFTDVRVAIGDGEPVTARVVIDTGAGHALSLNAREGGPFAPPARAIEAPVGRGLGGVLQGRVGRVRRVELGGFAFDGVVTSFPDPASQRPGGADFHDGNLGEELLRRFDLTFDYATGSLYLERAKGFAEPFEAEMAGLALDWKADSTLVVRTVLSGSPAEAAGLHAGDRLVAIDGETTAALGMDGVRKALIGDGAVRSLTIHRGDEELTVTVHLRRLV